MNPISRRLVHNIVDIIILAIFYANIIPSRVAVKASSVTNIPPRSWSNLTRFWFDIGMKLVEQPLVYPLRLNMEQPLVYPLRLNMEYPLKLNQQLFLWLVCHLVAKLS